MVSRETETARVVRYRDERTGRILQRQVGKGGPPYIYWSPYMIDLLRRYYPTTTNEEVAALLGVSVKTLIRKAKELGVLKSAAYLRKTYSEAGRIAQARLMKTGRHRRYRPGYQQSEETKQKIRETMRRFRREHPEVMRRAWEKRKNRQQNRYYEEDRH